MDWGGLGGLGGLLGLGSLGGLGLGGLVVGVVLVSGWFFDWFSMFSYGFSMVFLGIYGFLCFWFVVLVCCCFCVFLCVLNYSFPYWFYGFSWFLGFLWAVFSDLLFTSRSLLGMISCLKPAG